MVDSYSIQDDVAVAVAATSTTDDISASIGAFCSQLASAGMTQQQALNAVIKSWPSSCPRPRRIRIGNDIHPVGDEDILKEESAYFARLFDGPFREKEELVLDLSEVPGLARNPACFEHFLCLVSTRGETSLSDLGDNHICLTVDLLEISSYFEAPCLEEKCLCHLMNNLADLRTRGRSAIPNLSWHHLEQLLAAIQEKHHVIDIAASWCAPQHEDELSRYLAIRCGDLSEYSVHDILNMFGNSPHVLAKIPQAAQRLFRQMDKELAWLEKDFPAALRSALPRKTLCHPGTYSMYNPDLGGGWSCCHQRRKRVAPCGTRFFSGHTEGLFGRALPSLLQQVLQPGLGRMIDQYTEHLLADF